MNDRRIQPMVAAFLLLVPAFVLAVPPETPVPGRKPPEVVAKVPKPANGRPAIIATSALADFAALSAARQALIEIAIAVGTDSPWLPYLYGGREPAQGGFDCSGAMYYVMIRAGLVPPRTAAAQCRWLSDHGRLHRVAADAVSAADPSLARLKPGDLLFWSTDPATATGKTVNITHVAMYLGRELRDGRPVTIGSTDGRSYRGTKANGYGIYDFRVPAISSKSKLVGYGTPPGIPEIDRTPPISPDLPDATEPNSGRQQRGRPGAHPTKSPIDPKSGENRRL